MKSNRWYVFAILLLTGVVIMLFAVLLDSGEKEAELKPAKQFKSVVVYHKEDGELKKKCDKVDVDLFITDDTVYFKSHLYNIGYDPFVTLDSTFIVISAAGYPVEMHPRKVDDGEILYFVDNEALVVLSTDSVCVDIK